MTNKSDWWRGAVIYEIYPRSYMDSIGDGTGDLRGIISKLDYVASLGVDAIWISPFFKSPMADGGYDVADYRDVDPMFGTLDDFQTLLKEAHARGLKILIDFVLCHSSDQHTWFKESRSSKNNAKSDWYYWADAKEDGTPPNNWIAYFGGSAWHWDTRREQYYLGSFSKEQPSLNLWNEDVQNELLETARFWMDMGVDGFRLDAVQQLLPDQKLRDNPIRTNEHPPVLDIDPTNPLARQWRAYSQTQRQDILPFLKRFRDLADEMGGALLAEAGGDNSEQDTIFYGQGQDRFHFSYCYSFTYMEPNKKNIIGTIEAFEKEIEDGWICWAFGSHDAMRIISRFSNGVYEDMKERALLAMVLSFSLRGSYCIYQGEELGLEQAEVAYEDMQDIFGLMFYPEFLGRDGCRTPMPWIESAPQAGFSTAKKTWLPVYKNHLPYAVDQQDNDKGSTLNHYRRFLAWRKERPELRYGDIEILETPDDVVAYKRSHDGKTTLCVFNASNEKKTYDLPEDMTYFLISEYSNNAILHYKSIQMDRYGYAFFDSE